MSPPRFAAYNWRVIRLDNANDIAKCDAALAEALRSDGRPTLVIGKTSIGYGAPNKQGQIQRPRRTARARRRSRRSAGTSACLPNPSR